MTFSNFSNVPEEHNINDSVDQISENKLRLSPPWYTFFNYVINSVGRDRCVEVFEMQEISDGNFLIPIEVRGRDKAIALATILVPCVNFGNINVRIEVIQCGQVVKPDDRCQDECSLMRIFEEAFGTNHYYEYVEFRRVFSSIIVFPVFKKEVIQFFNDDLSDLNNSFNGVAAHVFAEVLEKQIDGISINPSTAIVNTFQH